MWISVDSRGSLPHYLAAMSSKTLKSKRYNFINCGISLPVFGFARCMVVGIICAVAILAAPGPALSSDDGPASYADERYYDPFEPANRVVFKFNQIIDELFLKPAARLYIKVVPDRGRAAVSNVIENLKSPVYLVNDILQGETKRAQITISRFTTNTILGFGGMSDVAADLGADPHSEDFGQTLATYGVGKGPYLMLPFFGPSTIRDAIGQAVDTFFDPLGYALETEESLIRSGIEGLDKRARFLDVSEAMEKTSIDYYASIRSVFLQNREYEIRNGAPEPIVDIYGNDSGN